jgi:hypothetical protein
MRKVDFFEGETGERSAAPPRIQPQIPPSHARLTCGGGESSFHAMKPKAVIITDPKKLRAICSNQPRVSQEQMRKSILAGIRSSHTQSPAKVS